MKVRERKNEMKKRGLPEWKRPIRGKKISDLDTLINNEYSSIEESLIPHEFQSLPLILAGWSRRILQDIQQTLFQGWSKVVVYIRAVLPLVLIVLSEVIQINHDCVLTRVKFLIEDNRCEKKFASEFSRRGRRSFPLEAERSDDAEAVRTLDS